MKTLWLIGGPMGIGKTTVGQALKKKLDRAVFLDGDWCWDADPFVVNEETKTMVMQNIAFLLAQFLRCTAYENIVFSWVMDEQEIIDSIVDAVSYKEAVRIAAFSLVGSEKCLTKRLEKDIANGIRQPDIVARLCALKRQMEK
ncbi:AAA family ATPase [uncultured Dubosiella sp.]|uniref:AAA family ATPase n=1 Tax=uncultured Dubosiella sp. TaxID=1937011 RepID=UPI0025B6211C|nr:AAA family ATPase [uncultured Dubosiella sp.]